MPSQPKLAVEPEERLAFDAVASVGRYEILGEIASGGMATVYFGRLAGAAGFSRTVAVKRLHAHLVRSPQFTASFADEARIVSRIRHPNVVPALDVVASGRELFVIMEYVHGESLAYFARALGARGERMPPRIAAAIFGDVLDGLHGAHETRDEQGEPLGIVHRDVSPQNILVGADGVARVVDFGVAKAAGRLQTTRPGEVKGKIAYMAPEQLLFEEVSVASDVYAAAVVLWEALAGRRLFKAENEATLVHRVLAEAPPPLRSVAPDVPEALERVVHTAMSRKAEARYVTAHAFAIALEQAAARASRREVAAWVEQIAGPVLAERAVAIEQSDGRSVRRPVGSAAAAATGDATVSAHVDGDALSIGGVSTASRSVVRRPRRSVVLLASGGTAVVVAVALFAATRRAAPAVAAIPLPPLSATESSAPSAGASTVVGALPSAPSATASVAPRAVPATTRPPPRRDCSPPFWVDGDGIRHVKRDCL